MNLPRVSEELAFWGRDETRADNHYTVRASTKATGKYLGYLPTSWTTVANANREHRKNDYILNF